MSVWKRISSPACRCTVLGVAAIGAAARRKVTVTSAATPSSAYQGTLSTWSSAAADSTGRPRCSTSSRARRTGGITVAKREVSAQLRASSSRRSRCERRPTSANFDIVVTLGNGRKGKGTTLFKVNTRPNPNDRLLPPTYPAARDWHAFTSNGGPTSAASRLYMYGGGGSDAKVVPADLWYYRAYYDQWTLVSPTSTTKPGSRQWEGLSCGAGACVMADGSNGVGLVNETWVYREATNAWTQANCGRTSPCPTARQMVTMAFDSQQGNHLLFGGRGSQSRRTERYVDVRYSDTQVDVEIARAQADRTQSRGGAPRARYRRRDAWRPGLPGSSALLRHVRLERLELEADPVRQEPAASVPAYAQHVVERAGPRRDGRLRRHE